MVAQEEVAAPIAKKVIKKVLERHELRQEINYLEGELFNVTTKIYSIILGLKDKIFSLI